MLLVKTKIGPSKIHGIGLFADEFIPKNTKIWEFVDGFDQKFTREQLSKLPKLAQIHFAKYAYLSKLSGQYILCADTAKHINHSTDPNTYVEYQEGGGGCALCGARYSDW